MLSNEYQFCTQDLVDNQLYCQHIYLLSAGCHLETCKRSTRYGGHPCYL
jgi:hypothetical protein